MLPQETVEEGGEEEGEEEEPETPPYSPIYSPSDSPLYSTPITNICTDTANSSSQITLPAAVQMMTHEECENRVSSFMEASLDYASTLDSQKNINSYMIQRIESLMNVKIVSSR